MDDLGSAASQEKPRPVIERILKSCQERLEHILARLGPQERTLIAFSQVVGAAGRIGVGHVSDVVGSRMVPLRWVAVAAGVTMVLLGLTARADWGIAVVLLVVATTVTVADNGLAFTAVAERAGPFWSGRALGVQNTAQFLTAAAAAPLAGAAITHWGYPTAFALTALGPLVATGLVPRDEAAFEH